MKISSFNFQLIRSLVICSFALITRCDESKNVKINIPKEILDIFDKSNHDYDVKNETFPRGSIGDENKIFAEGSSMNVKEQFNQTGKNITTKINSISEFQTSEVTSGSKSVIQPQKITTLDFLSSIEESTHSNRTSSIKPRKGVHYSKIVPKKGVNFEDFLNYAPSNDRTCFVINQTNCYDMDYYTNLVCTCCESSNELGKIIGHQPLTNCSDCTPVNKLPVDLSQPCSGICCVNVTLSTTIKSIVEINNTTNKNIIKNDNFNGTNEKSQIKKKLKPSVTNVPYDSDVSSAFNKTKGEKYVPIIVSIFVLPLVGILIFFTWKKTRELWDRRYYRRMDFLIDGMYNE